ncbi:MAG: LPS export ABC transporter periplasmic protein LptC [Chitinophagales bacterium]|nr:LPS export ABC transporter periplasmic protein LptC [Chitinophagales bacterium]
MKLLIPNIRQYIISCTLLSVVLLASCEENDIAKVKAMFDEKEVDVEVADSVQFIYKEDQYARAVVTGKTVKRYTRTQNKLEFTDGLIVRFYDQLKLISVLKADFAENNDSEQKVLVSGNVYMESAKYERMETQELTWDMRAKRVYTDKAIKIRTQDHIIYGVGFDSDEDFSNYTIRKVNGIVSVSDDNSFNNF